MIGFLTGIAIGAGLLRLWQAMHKTDAEFESLRRAVTGRR